MQYNITYREKDKGIQFIISYKVNGKWKQRSKQGFKKQSLAKLAADKELDKLKKDLELQSKLDREFERITFKEFSEIFMEHARLYKEGNTLINYNTAINRLNMLNDFELLKITNMDIQNCVDNLIKEGLKISSIKKYLSILHFIFNYAKKKKVILENPVSDIEYPKEKNKEEKKALTKYQLDDLLSKIKNRKYKIISMLAGKCGLRIGEICGLYRSDIDEKNRVIKIDHQWKKLKSGEYGLGSVKHENSKRIVPIPDSIADELFKYKNESLIYMDGRLFPNNASLTNTLKRVYKSIGYDISVHELRHTYATHLIANGMDWKTTAQFLGHDIKQTMNTYTHVTQDMINKAKKIINENL